MHRSLRNRVLPFFNQNSRKLNSNKAFTLAEVLITLVIIGIIAALTIPTLVNNYQKTQYVTQLKKAYSEVTQALKLMANDYGCPGDLKCTGLFAPGTSSQSFGDAFVKYFKVVKNCKEDTTQVCFSQDVNDYYDGSGLYVNDQNTNYRFITEDGTAFSIYNYSDNCDSHCGFMNIDVNGLKKPNYRGRDIFFFYITNDKGPSITPYGDWEQDGSCNSSFTFGLSCGSRVLGEDWQMNY